MHVKRRKNQGSEPFLNRPRLRKILGIKPPPVATKIGLAPEADATDESMKNAYVQINVEEYMKNRFPNFFPEDGTGSLNADEKLIHYLISFYVRIKDSLCALFPKRFNPDITDVDILNTLFKVVVVYFDGRESGAIKAPHPLYGLDL
jgi:hypothetical protein